MISNNPSILSMIVIEGFSNKIPTNHLRKLINKATDDVKALRVVKTPEKNGTWSATIALCSYESLAVLLHLDYG